MKTLLVALVVLFSQASHASSCFRPETIPSGSLLPEEVCLYDYEVKLVTPTFPELPYYAAVIESNLGVITAKASFAVVDGKHTVTVSKNLKVENSGVCESFYRSSLRVSFDVDADGSNPGDVRVDAVIESSPDQCHSTSETVEVPYLRVL